jgi:hypothetical protein
MRAYIQIPDALLPILQDQARQAHRPPRYHLEWLIEQVLQAHATDAQGAGLPPGPRPPPCALVEAGKELVS